MKSYVTPNTPSQRWARANGACLRGRKQLGKKSIGQYFRTSMHASNVMWILGRLLASYNEPMVSAPTWYEVLCNDPHWSAKAIREAAYKNAVQIPLEIA